MEKSMWNILTHGRRGRLSLELRLYLGYLFPTYMVCLSERRPRLGKGRRSQRRQS